MRMEETKSRFSQRHPLMFGVMLITLAVALILGAMAFFRSMGWTSGSLAGLGKDKLGLVRITGPIMDSTDVVNWMRTLREDESVKGVLLRVNSPGGAVAPSQEIYQAVVALAEVKPVIASYSTVAASGGYYASCPAQIIMANPGSITASIGVVAEFVTVTEALEKLGIKPEVLATGRYKGAGTPLRDLSPDQRDQLMGLILDLHAQFVDDVAKARGMDRDRVSAIADGRAVTGRQALSLGLVDMLGSEEQAFAKLKELAQIEGKAGLLEGPKEDKTFLQEVLGSFTLDLDSALESGWRFSYK